MDLEASTRHEVLYEMLFDENAEPTDLPLSLLDDITNHFSPDHEIGRGGFAVVYKGIVGNGMVAVKKLSRTIDIVHEKEFHQEVECLTNAKHKNIVRFLGYCAETHGKVARYNGKFVMADVRNWLLCFEYVPNGSLEKYITDSSGGLGWSERFRIIKGICEGLHYLHKNHIIHSDLKPANILLDGHMVPKIADFGLSRCLDNEQTSPTTKHLRGTPGYLAPEYYSGKITFRSDIYSLGVMIMEIVTGEKGHPEYERVIESWMNRLEGGTQLEQVRVCTNIAMECMESNPKKRPVAQCIISMLDKTASSGETGMGSSLVGLQIGLLKEQSDRERIGKLAGSFRQENMEERPETEDVAESLGTYHFQQVKQKTDNWSLWKAQDTKQKVNHKEASTFHSNSSMLDKFKFFNIFRRDAHRNFESFKGQILQPGKHLRIFAEEEINKITINNSEFLGRGSLAKVYKGTLPDYTMVAVKTLTVRRVNGDRNEEFHNAVEIQTGMIHKNILKLVGCCLEGDMPILVHEFAANGNLFDILHGNKKQIIPLDLRLDIAIGSAEGLRYMCSVGIRHGYIKPSNILLDETFTPKISGFELSQLLIRDEAVAVAIVGCMGYIDPVFRNTGLLTQKSDVYSFGAVLLELITRKKIFFSVNDDHCSLIREYHKCYDVEKTGRAMFDEEIAAEEDIFVLEEIGKLALECLNEDIEERPNILEVTDRLAMLGRDKRLGKAQNTKEKTAGPRHTKGI